jgi:ATP-dependent 26S proteasome regulatory subunit
LIGPPGTGKTSFIKYLLTRSGSGAKVSYDPDIIKSDSFFAEFVEGDASFMIFEDADAFLQSKKEGNTLMHRFLNVADGLVSTKGKKLIFSTNLPSITDIDEALIRPGRCFDICHFRNLTRDEAENVVAEIQQDISLPDSNNISLSEIFNELKSSYSS